MPEAVYQSQRDPNARSRGRSRTRKRTAPAGGAGDGGTLGALSKLLLVFAVVCFATAFYFNTSVGEVYRTTLPTSGGTIGPVEVLQEKAVYNLEIEYKALATNTWAYVEGSVLDENRNYLFAFGDEMYHETGYDSEGRWTEIKDSYDFKITFPEPGTFYVDLMVEYGRKGGRGAKVTQAQARANGMQIALSQKRGSSIPHLWAGILALALGGLLYYIHHNRKA